MVVSALSPAQLEKLAYEHVPDDRSGTQYAHCFGWLAGCIRWGYTTEQLEGVARGLERALWDARERDLQAERGQGDGVGAAQQDGQRDAEATA